MPKADIVTPAPRQSTTQVAPVVESDNRTPNGIPTDPVSRIASSREFHYELGRRFAEWERRRLPVSLVMLALDNNCGGLADEEIYKAVSQALLTTIRKMDLLTRSEQGEFIIIFPDTSIAGARQVAERIRRVITSTKYAQPVRGLALTISVGIAAVGADDNDLSLLARTKMALNESKACGGNCLRFHDGEQVVEQVDALIDFECQFAHARRMETVGRLAAGVAHEINTPIQYVGGNVSFLENAFADITSLLDAYGQLLSGIESGQPSAELVQVVKQRAASIDFTALHEEISKAIEHSLKGIHRVSQIVQSMKEFAHPDTHLKTFSDVNRIIESMVTVSTSEWKHVANVVTELDPTLPSVAVSPGEFGQVIINLLVNAAQAIAAVTERGNEKGIITLSTRFHENQVEIRIRDTGPGIPEEHRTRIYDQFFTTKPVGSGQGLALAYATIVNEHGGTLDFENEPVRGTTFIVRLPINTQEESHRETAYPLYRR